MSNAFSGGGIGGLLSALTGGRGGTDGLGDLVARLRQGGLQEEVDSWVGPGANRDVAPDRLAGALGQDELAGLAQRLGLGGGQGTAGTGALAALLAQLLPQLINGLTPQGRVPQSEAEYGAGGMMGQLSQLAGGDAAPDTGGGGIAGMLGALMGGGRAPSGGLGALLGGLMGGGGAQMPAGKPGLGEQAPLDKSHLGGEGGGPLPQKPRSLG